MDWITTLFTVHSALQAVVVLSLISALGLGLGKLRFGGISLGITFIFFVGIFFGHLGFSIDAAMLEYAESFGLVVFVYALGLQVGSGFFNSFRHGGVRLNLLALLVVALGTIFTIALSFVTTIELPDLVGIMCGATTNTPALAAAQQTLTQMNVDPNSPALGCAISYPLGVVGVILGMSILRLFFKHSSTFTAAPVEDEHKAYITSFHILNPAIYGLTIQAIAKLAPAKFVISRIWRDDKLIIPRSDMQLQPQDRVLVAIQKADLSALTVLFGSNDVENWNRSDIDWNTLDSQLMSQRFLITRHELNGKRLGSLRLRNQYGVNISRVDRGGVELLAMPDLVLQVGDRLTIVGDRGVLKQVEKLLGNRVVRLNEPNLVAVFLGLVLGLAVGAIPISVPSMSTPIKLGLAGGPILVGILIGTFGPHLHMITFVTRSANLMLQRLGLSFYLACLGLSAGAHFFETVMQGNGFLWIGSGFIITIVPVLLVGAIALKWIKMDYGTVCGMLCGSMANPMALKYADDATATDAPSIAYATVYPLSMFLRVLIAQLTLMLFL
ncbi:MAG: putative transporter [Bacteroidaceae bacterium]